MIIKRHKNKHKYVKFLISWYIFKVHSRKTPHKKINFFFHNHVLNTSYILALKVYSGEIYILNIMALLSFERWIEHQQTFQIKKNWWPMVYLRAIIVFPWKHIKIFVLGVCKFFSPHFCVLLEPENKFNKNSVFHFLNLFSGPNQWIYISIVYLKMFLRKETKHIIHM